MKESGACNTELSTPRCRRPHPKRAGDSAVLVTLFATRSVDAEATTGLAANGHMMMVGESGGESPFAASPRATRPSQWVAVEEAVAKCVSKPREGVGLRGGWVVPFSSGSGVRVPQRQRKRHQPRRAAPFGASCENRPVVRPFKVCLLYTSPSPRDQRGSRMPSSA